MKNSTRRNSTRGGSLVMKSGCSTKSPTSHSTTRAELMGQYALAVSCQRPPTTHSNSATWSTKRDSSRGTNCLPNNWSTTRSTLQHRVNLIILESYKTAGANLAAPLTNYAHAHTCMSTQFACHHQRSNGALPTLHLPHTVDLGQAGYLYTNHLARLGPEALDTNQLHQCLRVFVDHHPGVPTVQVDAQRPQTELLARGTGATRAETLCPTQWLTQRAQTLPNNHSCKL